MISFRYHLVTIVAVFLALALGVLAGTTVIKQTLVEQLRKNNSRVADQNSDLRSQVGELRGFVSSFVSGARDWLIDGALDGERAVVITWDPVDQDAVGQARDGLATAGAEVVTLTMTSKLASAGATEELADLLGVDGTTPPDVVVSDASLALADRLARGAGTVARPETDLLEELVKAGFVRAAPTSDLSAVGGPDRLEVVVGGGQAQPAVPIDTFVLQMVREMSDAGVMIAAGEGEDADAAAHPLVSLLRQDDSLSTDRLMTVDDMDQDVGGVALVLGLDRMLLGGSGGNYGTDEGAQLLPKPPTS
ncbi:MAG TPA: copper transporter [Actinomycetota bacterium]